MQESSFFTLGFYFLLFLVTGLPSLYIATVIAGEKPKKNNKFEEIDRAIPWDPSDVLRILIVIEVVFFAAALAIDLTPSKISKLLPSEIIMPCCILVCILYMIKKYSFGISSLGITNKNLRINLWRGLVYGVIVIIALMFIYINDWSGYKNIIDRYSHYRLETIKEMPFLLFVSILNKIIISPIIEESLYRGFIYPAFKKKISRNWAMLWSAVIWALIHRNLGILILVIPLGLILANIYERTKSLIPCFIIHSCTNIAQFLWFYYKENYKGIVTLSPLMAHLIAGSLLLLIFLILQYLAHREKARRGELGSNLECRM